MLSFPHNAASRLALASLLLTCLARLASCQVIDCADNEDCEETVSCSQVGQPVCEISCIGKDACKDFETTINFCGNKDCVIVCDGRVACGPASFSASLNGCANSNCVVLTDRADEDNALGLSASGFDEYDVSVGFGSCGSCCSELNAFDNGNNAFILNGCLLGCSGSSCVGPPGDFQESCKVGQGYQGSAAVGFDPPNLSGVDSRLLQEFSCVGGSLVSGAGTEAPTTEAPTVTAAPTSTESPTGTLAPTLTLAPTGTSAPAVTPPPSLRQGPDTLPLIAIAGVCSVLVFAGTFVVVRERKRRKQPELSEQQDDEQHADAEAPQPPPRRRPTAPLRPSSEYLERIKRSSVKSIFRPSSMFLKRAEQSREQKKFDEVEDIDDQL